MAQGRPLPLLVLLLLAWPSGAVSNLTVRNLTLRELMEAKPSAEAVVKGANEYDEDTASAFAALSKLAYCGVGPEPGPPYGASEAMRKAVLLSCGNFCKRAGFKVVLVELVSHAEHGQANADLAYVAKLEKAEWWSEKPPADCLVAFRGSWVHPANDLESENRTLYEFKTKQCDAGCKVVGGVLRIWNDLKYAIWGRLGAAGCDHGSTVAVTGHSTGGQVATLAMWSLLDMGFKVQLSYTFSAPTPFNAKAAAVFDFLLFPDRPVSVFRVTHANDAIPRASTGDLAQPGFQVWYPNATSSKHVLCGSKHDAPKCGLESIPTDLLCNTSGNPAWMNCGSSEPYGGPHCEHPLAPARSFCSFAGDSPDNFLSSSAATCFWGQSMQRLAAKPTYPPSSWPGRPPEPGGTLEDCLRDNVAQLQMEPHTGRSNATYDNWRLVLNRLPSASPKPLAVVRPSSEAEVQAAVRCAAAAGVQACARAGGHGFDNKAGCDGGVQIDLRGLLFYGLNEKVVTFGTGFWLGGLYYKLAQSHRVVPAGIVNSVGAAGLILGCGRGLFTTMYGLACDSILGVRYVDAQGHLREANATHEPDMYWMSRGGGGSFPGIVTRIVMQTYDMPGSIMEIGCTWEWGEEKKKVLRAWFMRQAELSNPDRKVYTAIAMFSQPKLRVKIVCLGCSPAEQAWARGQFNQIKSAAWSNNCIERHRSWLDQVVFESGNNNPDVFHPNSLEGLLDRKNGWGSRPSPMAMMTNGRLGYTWDVPDGVIDAIYHNVYEDAPTGPWSMFAGLYPITGRKVTSIGKTESAYGHRDAKWSFHWKYFMNSGQSSDYYERHRQHSLKFQRTLDAFVPCTNFFNYIDTDGMTCASRDSGDHWLQVYFSDVARLKRIKSKVDPNNTIRTAPTPAPRPKPLQKWTKVATTGQVSQRTEGGSYTWQGQLCLFGGRGTQPIECLTPSRGTWIRSAITTEDVHHIQPVVWNKEVWVVAGWQGAWPDHEKDLDKVVVYSPASERLRDECEIPPNFRVGSAGVVVHDDFIYVIGGSSGGQVRKYGAEARRQFLRFDPRTCSWQQMPSKPQHNRDSFQAVLVGSVVVIASGRDSPRSHEQDPLKYPVAPTERYDLALGEHGAWTTGADIPSPRSGAASISVLGLALVIGGEVGSGREDDQCPFFNKNLAFARVDAYNLTADKWSQLPDLNTGRHGAGAAVVEDASGRLELLVSCGAACTGGSPLLLDTEGLLLPKSAVTAGSTTPATRDGTTAAATTPTTVQVTTTTSTTIARTTLSAASTITSTTASSTTTTGTATPTFTPTATSLPTTTQSSTTHASSTATTTAAAPSTTTATTAAPTTTTGTPTTTTDAAPTITTTTATTVTTTASQTTTTASRTTTTASQTTTTTSPTATTTATTTSTATTTVTTTTTATTSTTTTAAPTTTTTAAPTTTTATPTTTTDATTTVAPPATATATATPAATTWTGTTFTATPVVITSKMPGSIWCFTNNTSYDPLDLESHLLSHEPDIWSCQQRCQKTAYCEFFTWIEAYKDCHITGGWAYRLPFSVGMVTGPRDCGVSLPSLSQQEKLALHEKEYSHAVKHAPFFSQGLAQQQHRGSVTTHSPGLQLGIVGAAVVLGLCAGVSLFALRLRLRHWPARASTTRSGRIYSRRDLEMEEEAWRNLVAE